LCESSQNWFNDHSIGKVTLKRDRAKEIFTLGILLIEIVVNSMLVTSNITV